MCRLGRILEGAAGRRSRRRRQRNVHADGFVWGVYWGNHSFHADEAMACYMLRLTETFKDARTGRAVAKPWMGW